MWVSEVSFCRFSSPSSSQFHSPGILTTRWRHKFTSVRCCHKGADQSARTRKSYYELLGVSADSSPQQIKEAYRKLQKKHHPDIAGQQGHDYCLMLNEAYRVLAREDLRREYDASIGQMRVRCGGSFSGMAYSSWKGPLRPQALFVDENQCIGCRECVHHAGNTFVMDDVLGCARVSVQYGDDDQKLEVSVDSCPVNCIHWVDREELPTLEFLIQPRQKEGYGVFGGGWERPANVFMAAKAFNKQLKQQAKQHQRNASRTTEEETPAQAEARANASMKIKMERFSRLWNWVKEVSGSNRAHGEKKPPAAELGYLLRGIRNARSVTLSNGAIQSVSLAESFLDHFPIFQKLVHLRLSMGIDHDMGVGDDFWKHQSAPECLFPNLKTIELHRFCGTKSEISLLKQVLKYVPGLDRMR